LGAGWGAAFIEENLTEDKLYPSTHARLSAPPGIFVLV
jgi:hypothetical protein